MRATKWKGWNGWILPAFILCIIISLVPWLIMIYNSFFNLSYAKPRSGQYIGLDNYRHIFSDDAMWQSIKVTVEFVAISLPLEFILGLVFALIMVRHQWLRKFTIPIIIIPMVISPSVVGLLWQLNLNPSFGPLGIFFRNLGLFQEGLLGTADTALYTLIAIDVWQWTPFMFLLFLAGLLGQAKEPLEAASVDGASSWQTFWHVTVPALKPIFIVGVLLRFTDAYKIFDTPWIMTGGGPGLATETLSIIGYRVNFKFWHIGYGAAIVCVIFLISYLASLLFTKVVQPPERRID